MMKTEVMRTKDRKTSKMRCSTRTSLLVLMAVMMTKREKTMLKAAPRVTTASEHSEYDKGPPPLFIKCILLFQNTKTYGLQ